MPSTSTLRAYSGDVDDNAPTRLYHGSSSDAPPPPPAPVPRTNPKNEKPQAPAKPLEPASVWKIPRKNAKYGAAAVVGAIGAGALYFSMGGHGVLTVTVSGPNGRAVDGVSVIIDGTPRCDHSPCRIEGLSAGAHLVRASGKGYQATADQAVSVASGEQATHNVSLAPAGEGTGVRVSAVGSGLKLYVDSQEIGELPQTEKNLSPGTHTIRVAGNDRYEAWEQRVEVAEGELKTIGPLKLRVVKGLATFTAGPGADGARVLLDGRLLPSLPSTIEVPVPVAGKPLKLTATKSGYSSYERAVEFDDGVAEKTFEITMAATGGAAAASHASSGSAPVSTRAPSTPVSSASRAPAQGKGVLNMNSIPVSNVILNGHPLGLTPKVGVQVPPGPQTVVFVHPELGRKVFSGTVQAGESKTFTARFK